MKLLSLKVDKAEFYLFIILFIYLFYFFHKMDTLNDFFKYVL